MKNGLFAILLAINISIAGVEPAKSIDDYSQEELVATRLAWAFQEDRIYQLKYEAKYIALNHVVQYICGNNYVATIDARNKTIKTQIGPDTYVILSYKDFSCLLRNETIVQLANEWLQNNK